MAGWHPHDAMDQTNLPQVHCGKESLLVMDNFSAHCSNDIINLLSKHHSSVALISGGCTSKQQSLDVSLNKAFKQVCRQEFQIYCHSQLAAMSNSAHETASKQDICQWVVKAQNYLSAHPEMISRLLALDGSAFQKQRHPSASRPTRG